MPRYEHDHRTFGDRVQRELERLPQVIVGAGVHSGVAVVGGGIAGLSALTLKTVRS
jgi:heterodisulfide reductase subunit A-like polyferredoxin